MPLRKPPMGHACKKNLHLNILPGLSQINKKGKEKRKKAASI